MAFLKSEFYAAGGRPVIYRAFSVRFEVNHDVGVNDSSGVGKRLFDILVAYRPKPDDRVTTETDVR